MVTAPLYAKWCERKLWTVHESICLMLAIEPDDAQVRDVQDMGGLDPLLEALEQYSELVAEAMKCGTFKPFSSNDLTRPLHERRVDPRAFLELAKTWRVAIPDELAHVLAREPLPPPPPPSVLEHIGRGYRGADHIEEAHEQVLGAALAALRSFPERCRDPAGIRRVIDENAPLIWPDTRCPPLTAVEIERLLGRWLDRLG